MAAPTDTRDHAALPPVGEKRPGPVLGQAAPARRQEVVETRWPSHDREDAAQRLQVLLDIRDDTAPEVVLDLQLHRTTTRRREDLAREVAQLRQGARPRVSPGAAGPPGSRAIAAALVVGSPSGADMERTGYAIRPDR